MPHCDHFVKSECDEFVKILTLVTTPSLMNEAERDEFVKILTPVTTMHRVG